MRKRIIIAVLALFLLATAAISAQPADLVGIAHVAFRVAHLEKSVQFYEALGFEKAFEFAEADKVTEEFIKVNDRQFIELYPRTQESQSLGLMHVCFEASDIEAVRRRYAKLGLNPSEVKKFRAGDLLFVLHDPNGQLVEFTQYWPGSLHAEDRGKHLGSRRASDHLRAASTPVKDVDAARVFYVDKLGFTDSGSTPTSLRLPGNSGDELELQLAATSTKSQIGFAVGDVKQTADLLRKRGLTPRMEHGAVMVNDPDRTLIVFGDTSSTQKP